MCWDGTSHNKFKWCIFWQAVCFPRTGAAMAISNVESIHGAPALNHNIAVEVSNKISPASSLGLRHCT